MKTIKLKINNIDVEVEEGTTILAAAKTINVEIPSLCYLKGINAIASCRVCVVEVKGKKGLLASCVYPVEEGMEVFTNTPNIRTSRKTTIELILSSHQKKCLSCVRGNNCELQKLSFDYGVDEDRFVAEEINYELDDCSDYVVRDNNKCIMCRRCTAVCEKIQGVNAIGPIQRGYKVHIGCAFEKTLDQSTCVGCGQCIVACPVGALNEKSSIDEVWDAIADPSKKVMFFTAPSIRATLGECFDMPIGTNVEGKMVAAIRRLGVDKIFNMDFAADLTIMEEANEFLERVQRKQNLPLITSCSPGWVKFCEHNFPEFIPNLSTCKSPQQMFGAILKSYYAQKAGIDPKDMYVVSVIPCTAKKFECKRPEQKIFEFQDVDAAITTRELSKMIKGSGLKFVDLDDEKFDEPFEVATGAGAIFGASGGVMEAALRTAGFWIDKSFDKIEFAEVRGSVGIKEATYTVGGIEVKAAVVSGLEGARRLLNDIKDGKKNYDIIEVMACPGGCINGGGQPVQGDSVRNYTDLKTLRSKALYDTDKNLPLRRSHENPAIIKLYQEFLDAPGKPRAHKLLHTHYVKRAKN